MALWQLYLSALIAVGLTAVGCYIFLGLRGFWFGLATLILWFPVSVAWNFIFPRLVPPRLEAYIPKDTRTIKSKPKDSDSRSDLDLFRH